jgi:hypothetical protein
MSNTDTKPEDVEHWRGAPFLKREGAPKTYLAARRRVRKMDPPCTGWRDYLARASEYGLPTEPHKLWPEEWEKGGRYAGYLGTGVPESDVVGMLSSQEARGQLGIGKAVFTRLMKDLKPDARIAHKRYYKPQTLRRHLKRQLARDDIKLRKDAEARIREALPKLRVGS